MIIPLDPKYFVNPASKRPDDVGHSLSERDRLNRALRPIGHETIRLAILATLWLPASRGCPCVYWYYRSGHITLRPICYFN